MKVPPFFMSILKRFSYSILFSTLVFTIFAVVAFSGLFPWIEVQFYSPKVVASFQSRLDGTRELYEKWQREVVDRLNTLIADSAYEGVFGPSASKEVLEKRYQSTRLFLRSLHGGSSLRILNQDGTQVHFSSEDDDIKSRSSFGVVYHLVSELHSIPGIDQRSLIDGLVHRISIPFTSTVYYLVPWKDRLSNISGFLLLNISLEDFQSYLETENATWGSEPILTFGSNGLLMSLMGQRVDATLLEKVRSQSSKGVLPPFQRLARSDGTLTIALVRKGENAVLVSTSSFELDPILKILLLISFYTVIFLISFLLANLRGEPLSVVTRKVKRFQLQVVKQYLDVKEKDKIQTLREELSRHADEIQADVKRSLGRVRKRDREWVDRYIDTSWQEVLDLLRGPSSGTESNSQADWKRLETLLQQALTQGRFVVSSQVLAENGSGTKTELNRSSDVVPFGETEELLEELDEVDEVEPLDELEATDEPHLESKKNIGSSENGVNVEEIEELEEVEELEELTDTEVDPEAGGREFSKKVIHDDQKTFRSPADDVDGELEFLEELEEGDADETEGSKAGELQEMAAAKPQSDIFHLRQAPGTQGEVMTLPPAEDDDLISEIEELDELEEVSDDPDSQIDDLELSLPLEHLDKAWGNTLGKVFSEVDDVVTLNDELFATHDTPSDPFANLVEDVLAGPEGRGFVPLEEDVVPFHLVREWKWTGGGFDWDRFALGTDEINLFRALSEIVTEMDAFTAAILTETVDGWTAQSSVGFSDSGKNLLNYGLNTEFSKKFLSVRALHILRGGGANGVLRQSFHPKDLKFLKTVICVPLLFRHESAWLILGLRHDVTDLIALLSPRQVG